VLAGLVLPTSARAQANPCGRPAIFWNTGSGSFDNGNNFSGSGTPPGCAPLPTDNVTFGGTGFPQAGGTVTFGQSATVNSLIAASEGWIFNLQAPVTATSGLSFGNVSLTLMGGSTLSTSATGSVDGSTLIIPDTTGVTAGSFSVNSLTMSGGGNLTVLGGATGSGANLFSVALSNNSSIDLQGGAKASFINIGSGTINDSQISVTGATLNNVLWLAGENNNSTLTVSNGSVLTTQQLYVSAATNSTVIVTGTGTRISAGSTTVYGGLTLQNGAAVSSGALSLLTGAGGVLTIQTGAQLTSSSATVTGNEQPGPNGFSVTGQNSIWSVNGPMSISNTTGLVSGGAQLQLLGGGGNLVIANQVGTIGTLDVDGAGSSLTVAGTVTVGQAGSAILNLTNGATLDPPNVVIGALAPPANAAGPTSPETGLHLTNVSLVTVSTGAQLSTGDLTVGQAGYGSLLINAGSVVSDGSSIIASQAGSEGQVNVEAGAASWQANDLTVGGSGKGVLNIDLGNVTTSSDVIVGSQEGAKGTLTIAAGTLAVGGNLTVGSQGTGMFSEDGGTLSVAGTTTVGDQTGGNGKMTLDSQFSLGSSLIVGNATGSTGSVLIQLGATNSGGGASLATPEVILGDQPDANGSLSLDGSGTAFETSSLTIGSFGMGKLGLTNGALLVSNGPVLVAGQASSLIDAVTVASLSNFNVNNTLTVGSVGIATLALTTGGKVTSIGDLTLGDASSASGLVTVSGVQSGVASTINYQSALIVGHNGTGSLTVSDGGLVAPTASGSGSVEVGALAGSTGTVSVSGADAASGLAARLFGNSLAVGGTALAAGGTGKVTVGTGGVIDIADTLTVWKHGTLDVTGSGSVTVGTGTAAAAGTVRIDAGGTLTGPGTIIGNLVNAGGRVSPGDPVTLTVNGNYTQTGGVLDLQIAGTGPGQADMLAVSGDVQITGGAVDLEFINGFAPTKGDEFTLFSAAGVNLSNDVFEVDGAPANFGFTTSFDPANDTYEFSDTGSSGGGSSGGGSSGGGSSGGSSGGTHTVPEPPTWMLTLLAFGLTLAAARSARPAARARRTRRLDVQRNNNQHVKHRLSL
jgi:T5SS/PEP-CTERM-associated repeat protein